MKTAFVLYDGFSALEFAALYEPLTQGQEPGRDWDVCAQMTDIYDARGLHFYPTRVTPSLAGYPRVIIPGGPGAAQRADCAGLLKWIATAKDAESLVATGDGVLLLAAAGLARGCRVAAAAENAAWLAQFGAAPVDEAVVQDGRLITAQGPEAAPELLSRLCAGGQAAEWQEPIPVTGEAEKARRAVVQRETGETRVEVRLDIDGAGRHQVDTGLPFLDHMLAQVAVHGLFDLYVQAKGDLQIDPHHTLEDVALTLGSAFQQALGDRAGIVRMASADCPMDESLAWVAVDFSGRPYSVIQADWHGPSVGNLPVSLIPHFLESFALNARCNLHATVRYGRDDHHQAEAIFKALGRVLCAATRVDPRRAGQVPSSKGKLF